MSKKKNKYIQEVENSEGSRLMKEAKIEFYKEKIRRLLYKNRKLITISIAVLAMFLAIWIGFNLYKQTQEKKYSTLLQKAITALQKYFKATAQKIFQEIYQSKTAPSGPKSLASLKYAAALFNQGKKQQAIEVYLNINDNKGYDEFIREFAGLLALKIMISEQMNQEKIADLIAKLEINSKSLKYFIIEQKAIFEWQNGNFKAANDIFKDLEQNPESLESIKARAKSMNEIYSSK